MKSNIKENINKKIILSVGMIVKNEEKHLEKCLSALKHLLDNVSSELIIVDTGSTDKTKEIALKYTDKVYDFEWINDFSAARNYGLKKATGEWFMFVDADEYLDEDCDEMIKFFNMPEVRERYNSASFYINNYGGASKRASNQFLAPRIVRLIEGVEFHDAIHEWIPQPNPHGFFSTVFHHYGYAYTSEKEKNKKRDRNLGPILEEYKNNPKDMRVLAHLCDAIAIDGEHYKTNEDIENVYLEYLNEARKNINQPYATAAFVKTMLYYIINDRYKDALKISDEYLKIECFSNTVSTVTVYYLLTSAYMCKNDFKNAFESLKKYFEYIKKYKDCKLEIVELRYSVLQGLTDYDYEEQLMTAARCLNNLERYNEALEYLDKVDISEMNFAHLRLFLNIIRDLMNKTKNYSHVAKIYEKILKLNDDDKTGLVLFLLEQYYMEHPKERKNFVNAMLNSGVKGKYIDLIKIIKNDNDGKDISESLQKFVNQTSCWNDGYSEAIYLAMKHNIDLSNAINCFNQKCMKEILQRISEAHSEYANVALNYCTCVDFTGSIRSFQWIVSALECAVGVSNELDDDTKLFLYDTFISMLSDYVMNIYNPDLFNVEDVEILPELHRFGYYMTLAFVARNEGNDLVYIRCMKDALKLCESMKDLVSFYLSEFEKTIR